MRPYSRVYAEIDLDAVKDNMKAMRAGLPAETAIMGVVKADGYGHGAVPVARAIEPYVEGYAVATIDEGILLRRHGIGKRILVLGVTHSSRYEDLAAYRICPAMFRREELEGLSEVSVRAGKRTPVHLAVDTGMSRIGMKPDEKSADMVKEMSELPGILLEGMFTHFARADEADKSAYREQLRRFLAFSDLLEARGVHIPIRHCSNSAAITEGLDSDRLDMARAGISIYGMYASDEVSRTRVALRPALALKTCITYIKEVEPGTAVSYGGTFVAERPMRVATIPVGYGDGYPRGLSGRGQVLIHGRRASILGRICMDQFMVDVTDIPEAAEDDEVILIGRDRDEEITAEELARRSGGYHYELVCNLGKRVPRVYLEDGRIVGTKDYFQDVYEL